MKSKISFAVKVTAVLATVILTACTTDLAAKHRQHHPESNASQMSMGMGAGPMGKGMMMSDADMKSMCDMHEKMMGAKTPAEQKAVMAEHMKTMSPEMMKRHMGMMQSEMQMMKEHMGTQAPAK